MSPEGKRRTRLDPDERRAEILTAGRRVLSERPYSEVSVAEIAGEAGVSRALVNHYFDGKQGVLLDLLREVAESAPVAMEAHGDLPLEGRVSLGTAAWLDFARANHDLELALSGLGPAAVDPDVERMVEELRERIVDRLLDEHLGTTDVPPAVRFALRAYTGMFQVAVRDWLTRRTVTREQAHRLLSGSLVALLRDVVPALEGRR